MQPTPFSTAIKARRYELGLSLKEAARATGIQPSRLHDLEQGRSSTTGKPTSPTRDNINRLAKGYKLPEAYLLDLTGHPRLDPDTEEERRLISQFRKLAPGHRRAVLALISALYQIEATEE